MLPKAIQTCHITKVNYVQMYILFIWAFVASVFNVCSFGSVAKSVVLVRWPAIFVLYILVSPSHGARHPMQESFCKRRDSDEETPRVSTNETFGEINKIRYEWLFMFQRKKYKTLLSVTNFEKHRDIKPGLNEKCLNHFRVFRRNFVFASEQIFTFSQTITRLFPFSQKELNFSTNG